MNYALGGIPHQKQSFHYPVHLKLYLKSLVAEIISYDSQASYILIMPPGTIVVEPDT